LTKHLSADQALPAALGALSTIRHKSMPMIHTLLILSGIGPHSLNNADPIGRSDWPLRARMTSNRNHPTPPSDAYRLVRASR